MEPIVIFVGIITTALVLFFIFNSIVERQKVSARKRAQKTEEEKLERLKEMRAKVQAESEKTKRAALLNTHRPHINPATQDPYPGYVKWKDQTTEKTRTASKPVPVKTYDEPNYIPPGSSRAYAYNTTRNDDSWITAAALADTSDDIIRSSSSSSSSSYDCGSVISDSGGSCSWD